MGCRKLNLPACEPQWQAKGWFTSCKACARKKKVCLPTKIWREKVAIHNQTWVLGKGSSQSKSTVHFYRSDGPEPPIADAGNTLESQADDAPPTPPRKRRRIEEDGESEESEESEETSAELWVGRGVVRSSTFLLQYY